MPVQSPSVRTIFERALELPAAKREAFLEEACAGSAELRAKVDALLFAHTDAGSFLEPPFHELERTVLQPQVAERPGAVIGPYKLLQQIGEGGMGVVFMAEQSEPIKRTVALKIIKPGMDSRQVIARFEAERQALALMDHPNIAKVLDASTTETGLPYFVMELVKGIPITKFCDDKQLRLRDRLKLFLPVCQAVQHAHQKGIIHRDLKPSNVLVAEYDNHAVPKIIDFGVAKATAQKLTERTMFTEFGQIIGTVEYMSPEQAKFNQLDIDTRSDIYSLGVLLYELLTGSTPFEQKRLREAAFDEVLRIIREEEPPKPSTRLGTSDTLPSIAANRQTEPNRLSKDVNGELDWIVMKCLDKDRNRRYETANGLASDVQRYLVDEPVEARRPTRAYLLKKYLRRNKLIVLAASAVLAALTTGLIASLYFAASASHEARRATAALSEAEANREQAEGINRFFTEEVFGLADPNRYDQAGISLVEALDIAANKIDSQFPDDPELRAVVRERVGEVYSEIDEPNKAVEQLKAAIQLRQRAFGDKDARTLRSRGALGDAFYKTTRLSEAKATLESALTDQTVVLGPGHPDRIRTANTLALVLMSLRDPNDLSFSEQIYQESLRLLGPDHASTLTSQAHYAWVLRWRAEKNRPLPSVHPDALQLAGDAARGLRRTLGDNNVSTMYAWYSFAAGLRDANRYQDAADEFQQLLPARYRILGKSHVDSLWAAWRLAECRQLSGDVEPAVVVLTDVRSRLPLIESADKVRRAEPLKQMARVAFYSRRVDLAADFAASAGRMYASALTIHGEAGVNFDHISDVVTVLLNNKFPAESHQMAFNVASKACEATGYKNAIAIRTLALASCATNNMHAAGVSFDKAIAHNPKNLSFHSYAAISKLLDNDLAEYQQRCHTMLSAVAKSTRKDTRRTVTFAACLAPVDEPDRSTLRRTAESLAAEYPKDAECLAAKGIVYYRLGEFQSASQPLKDAIAASDQSTKEHPGPVKWAQFVLAMTEWQLKDYAAARKTLVVARTVHENEFPTHLQDSISLNDIFRREAESLISEERNLTPAK